MAIAHRDGVLSYGGEHAGRMIGGQQNETPLWSEVRAALSPGGLLQDELRAPHADFGDAVEDGHGEECSEIEDVVFEAVRDHDKITSRVR